MGTNAASDVQTVDTILWHLYNGPASVERKDPEMGAQTPSKHRSSGSVPMT